MTKEELENRLKDREHEILLLRKQIATMKKEERRTRKLEREKAYDKAIRDLETVKVARLMGINVIHLMEERDEM